MLPSLLIFIASFIAVHGRITFTTSEVLDTVDLKGTDTATFKCYAGCRVYSPTRNANIVIVDNTGKEYKTLMLLSNLRMDEYYELPPSNALYQLKNKGAPNPAFLFYAVEKGATNYQTSVMYLDSATTNTVDAKSDAIVTFMSSSGAVRFSGFQGDFSAALPTVHATPFDSIGACRAVYTASSASTILNTDFPIYSPIATINFKTKGAGKSVVVSGDYSQSTSTAQGSSSVFSSPGYVGCNSVGDSLYTFLPRVVGIDSIAYLSNNGGLHAVVNGEYSIAKEADAVKINVNGDEKKLFGKNTISQAYDGTNLKITVSWSSHEDSKDRFALQIDVTSTGAGPVGPTTGPVGPTKGPNPPNGQTTPKVQVTTSSVNSLGIFASLLTVVMFFLFR